MKRNTLKADNRGLTLTELLIGVAILAVIITPLLHTFITGANTVKKSKVHSDATLAAQNIIEEIKARDISSYLAEARDNGRIIFEESGEYLLEINNIVESGGTSFDAELSIEALKTAPVPISNSMDAVFRMQDDDSPVLDEYDKNANKVSGAELTRNISIDVSENGYGKYKADVKFEYDGPLTSGQFTRTVSKSVDISQRTPDKSKDAFAIYLFFTAYPISDNDFAMGNIKINNNSDRSFNVFLVDVGSNTDSIDAFNVEYKLNLPNPQPVVDVMTNMRQVRYKSATLPASLVETAEINYSYNIEVKIYRAGSDKADSANLLASMTATKFDYSDK